MQLNELYSRIITVGIKNDPRSQADIEKYLADQKKTYNELSEKAKLYFDTEKFANPYSDTRILYGSESEEIASILVGIDVETQDLLLAANLRASGKKIDAVLAHHPVGKALAELGDVMSIQEDLLNQSGVPINVAQDLMHSRILEVRRGLMPYNHARSVTAAKLLEIPFLCAHTPADNCVHTFLEKLFEKEKPASLQDIIDCLLTIPEYQASARQGILPTIIVGDRKRKPGKIAFEMTGGTTGSEDIFAGLQNAGVGTLISMHMPEKHRKEAEKNHINVIIAGHISSDTLGMNLLLDNILPNNVEVIGFSGFERIKR